MNLLPAAVTVIAISLLVSGTESAEAHAAAPVPSSAVQSERDEQYRWNFMPPWLGWKWSSPFGNFSGSVSIYFTYTTEGAPAGRPTRLKLVARRVFRERDKSDRVQWTESDRCPALLEAARQFQELPPPRTVISGLTWPPDFPLVVLDGMSWTLWSNTAQQEGRHPASYSFSSNTGPIADWGERTQTALDNCWDESTPPEKF